MCCIITRDPFGVGNNDVMYLAWQTPAWDEDGYFWTWKDSMKEILHNNTPEHPFLFNNREEAKAFLEKHNLPQKCEIIRWVP